MQINTQTFHVTADEISGKYHYFVSTQKTILDLWLKVLVKDFLLQCPLRRKEAFFNKWRNQIFAARGGKVDRNASKHTELDGKIGCVL